MVLVVCLFIGFSVFGWINNIVKLANADWEKPYGMEVIRIVGIPTAPLGVVLGYINFAEEKK